MDIQPLLIVEDETLIRLGLVELLEANGYTVIDAANGSAGINQVGRRTELSGLLTDINLGSEVTGWTIARQARKKFPNLAVVYITGDSVDDWPSEGVPNSTILQKPFADAQVVTAVATLLLHSGNHGAQSDVTASHGC